jgi:hypothetical protein
LEFKVGNDQFRDIIMRKKGPLAGKRTSYSATKAYLVSDIFILEYNLGNFKVNKLEILLVTWLAVDYLEFDGFEQDIARFFNIFCSVILLARFNYKYTRYTVL